jgi:Predicted hydrolases or acyltransferases (alpha/beta hydrolase superfamily)
MGQGQPFILLHGNGESHKIFDKLSKHLSRQFTVYAIDSRGHGESSKVKSLDYREMAEDIAQFIKEKNIIKPVLYGFSDGGILGLILAAKYPEMLSKLIISGANTVPGGIKTFYLITFQLAYFFTRDMKYKLMITQPQISDLELQRITIPTLILAGSNDLVKYKHTKHIAANISGSILKIAAGENHMSYVLDNSKLYKIIETFLTIHYYH